MYTKRYPLKELKDFHNEFICKRSKFDIEKSKIKSFSQFQIIKFLLDNRDRDVYQKDFEDVIKIRKSTISGILNTMEKNNIIVRLQSTSDGRGKIIKLTDEALKFHERMERDFDELNSRVVEGIDEIELETFFRVLDRMKENLNRKEM